MPVRQSTSSYLFICSIILLFVKSKEGLEKTCYLRFLKFIL